jgi:hypothetical protein
MSWIDRFEQTPLCDKCNFKMRLTGFGKLDDGCYIIVTCPNPRCNDRDMCWGHTLFDALRRLEDARDRDVERREKEKRCTTTSRS